MEMAHAAARSVTHAGFAGGSRPDPVSRGMEPVRPMTTLILARYPLGARLATACRAVGLAVGPRGGFGPGRKAVILLDFPAFQALTTGNGGGLHFGREADDPVVIVVGRFASFRRLAAISRAGAIGLGESDLDLLPLVLQRLVPGSVPCGGDD